MRGAPKAAPVWQRKRSSFPGGIIAVHLLSAESPHGFSLGRSRRLDKRAFVRVLESRLRLKQDAIQLQARPDTTLSVGRVAVAVPKKYFKRAIDRNRAKRILREQFRLHQIRHTSADVVLSVRAKFDLWSAAGKKQFVQSIVALLNKGVR